MIHLLSRPPIFPSISRLLSPILPTHLPHPLPHAYTLGPRTIMSSTPSHKQKPDVLSSEVLDADEAKWIEIRKLNYVDEDGKKVGDPG